MALADLALLACPVGMGAMMWLMMRGGHSNSGQRGPGTPGEAQQMELARLRAELDQLKAAERDRAGDPRP